MFERVLAVVDANPSRHKVLAVAAHLATSCADAVVYVLDVEDDSGADEALPDALGQLSPSALTFDSVRHLQDAGVDSRAATHGEPWMTTAQDVLTHAREHAVDLIVMAPHHRTMMAGMLFGTLTQSLDRGMNVSLLFVH